MMHNNTNSTAAAIITQQKPEVGICELCMEDGRLRNCCNRHYCKLCYEGTGNCPGCNLITVGANRDMLQQDMNKTNKDATTVPLVRDGEECRSCLRRVQFNCGYDTNYLTNMKIVEGVVQRELTLSYPNTVGIVE